MPRPEKPRYKVHHLKQLKHYVRRFCAWKACGERLMPRVVNGELEPTFRFNSRLFCSDECKAGKRAEDRAQDAMKSKLAKSRLEEVEKRRREKEAKEAARAERKAKRTPSPSRSTREKATKKSIERLLVERVEAVQAARAETYDDLELYGRAPNGGLTSAEIRGKIAEVKELLRVVPKGTVYAQALEARKADLERRL